MADLTLITGGARSGKSGYALRLAESLPGDRVFLATATAGDPEMAARIARHQAERAARGWTALEEPVAVPTALRELRDVPVVLLDCLTLWTANLMWAAETRGELLDEDAMAEHAAALVAALTDRPGASIVVTNEVGLGVVPDNALARRFRDLAGRLNQAVAAAADRVVLMVSGLPVTIKGQPALP